MKIIFGNHNRFSFLRTMRMISVNMWKHPAKIYWFNYSLFISYYSNIRTQSIFVLNPIFDGVWCRCHTLQLFKHYYSKIMHPIHPIILYIWSHGYPLQLRPKKCFKMSNVLELHNLWRSERKQPIKNRVKRFCFLTSTHQTLVFCWRLP